MAPITSPFQVEMIQDDMFQGDDFEIVSSAVLTPNQTPTTAVLSLECVSSLPDGLSSDLSIISALHPAIRVETSLVADTYPQDD